MKNPKIAAKPAVSGVSGRLAFVKAEMEDLSGIFGDCFPVQMKALDNAAARVEDVLLDLSAIQ